MALRIITPPPAEPLTLAEVKEHLRVTTTNEDSIIAAYLAAARQSIEGPDGFTGRAFVAQTWELVIDEFPTAEVKIPLPPLREVVSIKYDDGNGDEQTLDPSLYYVDDVSEPGWIVPVTAGWPSTLDAINAVRVRFTAGYAPDTGVSPTDYGANVPDNIKSAILLLVGSLYENREEVVAGTTLTELPWGVEALLRPSRVQLGMA